MTNQKHRKTVFVIPFAVLCFAVAAFTQAVNPPPDGGYPGFNTAAGQNGLLQLTTGVANTAVGWFSLSTITAANANTAVGAGALLANIGDNNTATGAGALLSNTTGTVNTANGAFALFSNTTGAANNAIGDAALFDNTVGTFNNAIGREALTHNQTGGSNNAVGDAALTNNIDGNINTAIGDSALYTNTFGDGNTACGVSSLGLNTTGNNNTALGVSAGINLTTGNNNIDVGFDVRGFAGESNTIRIGNTDITDTYIRGISGATASGGAAVFVNANGRLGTLTSSARFKDDIKSMDKASETLFSLRPVTFRYKKEIDPLRTAQFGLVAEEVDKVNPALVVRDQHGRPHTVRYEQINAMLLNEFLKAHRQIQAQRKQIDTMAQQVQEQAAQIQKVSAQLQVNLSATPQIARARASQFSP